MKRKKPRADRVAKLEQHVAALQELLAVVVVQRGGMVYATNDDIVNGRLERIEVRPDEDGVTLVAPRMVPKIGVLN